MAEASARVVMALRRLTDLPIRDCQALLREHGGDVGRAVAWMRAQRWLGTLPAGAWDQLRRDLAACGASAAGLPGSADAEPGAAADTGGVAGS